MRFKGTSIAGDISSSGLKQAKGSRMKHNLNIVHFVPGGLATPSPDFLCSGVPQPTDEDSGSPMLTLFAKPH